MVAVLTPHPHPQAQSIDDGTCVHTSSETFGAARLQTNMITDE